MATSSTTMTQNLSTQATEISANLLESLIKIMEPINADRGISNCVNVAFALNKELARFFTTKDMIIDNPPPVIFSNQAEGGTSNLNSSKKQKLSN